MSIGWYAAAMGVAVHLGSTAVWAQKPGIIPNEDSGWLQLVIAGGIIVVVGLTAFLNPKRSHLN